MAYTMYPSLSEAVVQILSTFVTEHLLSSHDVDDVEAFHFCVSVGFGHGSVPQ